MPDQLLRADLLGSDRWLDLPNDTDRLAFIALLLPADDFGNLEGGLRKIWRHLAPRTQIKTEEACAVCLTHLTDADLVRPYQVETRDYLHIPRFRTHRSYLVRKCPPSPWCNPEKQLGKHVRKIINQGHAKNLPVTSLLRNSDVLHRVGVGVGVGVEDYSVMHTSGVGGAGEGLKPAKATVAAIAAPSGRLATRLGDETWQAPDEWIEWAVQAFKLERKRAVRISHSFRDYWIAKAGQDGCKLDWFATWRNWVRKDTGNA